MAGSTSRRLSRSQFDNLIKQAQRFVVRGAFLIYQTPTGIPNCAQCHRGSVASHLRQYRPDCEVLFMEQYDDDPAHIVPQVKASIQKYWEVVDHDQ